MKMAIVGSRSIANKQEVMLAAQEAIDKYCKDGESIVILSGGAKGVDTLAKEYADSHGFDFVLFKPYHMIDTKVEYSPRFFFARNKQIADNADVVVIVWDGESNGTRHMIDYCRQRKKPYVLCTAKN